jgi:hypothetical protein
VQGALRIENSTQYILTQGQNAELIFASKGINNKFEEDYSPTNEKIYLPQIPWIKFDLRHTLKFYDFKAITYCGTAQS